MALTLSVLLIDDDADDRDIFTWVVKGIDPTLMVQTASDGFEALDLLKQESNTFDLIFLDLNMPRMQGLEVLQRIRQMEGRRETPVIVYSTYSNPHDMETARTSGASDYIVKGYELSIVRNELTQVLKKHDPRLTHTYGK